MARALEAGPNRMQVAPKRRKKPAAPEAGLNPVQVAPTRNPPRPAPEAEPKLPPRVAEAGRNSAGGAIRSIREPLNPIVFNHHQPAPLSRRFPGGRGEIRSEIVSLPTPLLFDSKTTSNCHSKRAKRLKNPFGKLWARKTRSFALLRITTRRRAQDDKLG